MTPPLQAAQLRKMYESNNEDQLQASLQTTANGTPFFLLPSPPTPPTPPSPSSSSPSPPPTRQEPQQEEERQAPLDSPRRPPKKVDKISADESSVTFLGVDEDDEEPEDSKDLTTAEIMRRWEESFIDGVEHETDLGKEATYTYTSAIRTPSPNEPSTEPGSSRFRLSFVNGRGWRSGASGAEFPSIPRLNTTHEALQSSERLANTAGMMDVQNVQSVQKGALPLLQMQAQMAKAKPRRDAYDIINEARRFEKEALARMKEIERREKRARSSQPPPAASEGNFSSTVHAPDQPARAGSARGDTTLRVQVGSYVVIRGVSKKPELNGTAALVLARQKDRWRVKLLQAGERNFALREDCLELLMHGSIIMGVRASCQPAADGHVSLQLKVHTQLLEGVKASAAQSTAACAAGATAAPSAASKASAGVAAGSSAHAPALPQSGSISSSKVKQVPVRRHANGASISSRPQDRLSDMPILGRKMPIHSDTEWKAYASITAAAKELGCATDVIRIGHRDPDVTPILIRGEPFEFKDFWESPETERMKTRTVLLKYAFAQAELLENACATAKGNSAARTKQPSAAAGQAARHVAKRAKKTSGAGAERVADSAPDGMVEGSMSTPGARPLEAHADRQGTTGGSTLSSVQSSGACANAGEADSLDSKANIPLSVEKPQCQMTAKEQEKADRAMARALLREEKALQRLLKAQAKKKTAKKISSKEPSSLEDPPVHLTPTITTTPPPHALPPPPAAEPQSSSAGLSDAQKKMRTTGYNIFSLNEVRVIKEGGNTTWVNEVDDPHKRGAVFVYIGKKWKALPPEQKAVWNAEALQQRQMARHAEEEAQAAAHAAALAALPSVKANWVQCDKWYAHESLLPAHGSLSCSPCLFFPCSVLLAPLFA